ncbi:MAG TPA: L-lactate dehydrogenase [Candidatus Limnocylindrales bacterium]|nr:L-lactate dehydrogenase [Candidatus Limnocylindrales bacterium]
MTPDASPAHPSRVVVVGAGHVGASFAYALVLSGLASEIVLIDADRRRAEGEAMDLAHAVPFAKPARIWDGDYPDCTGAAVTVIAAGGSQRPGERRLDLARRNAAIAASIARQVGEANPDGIILVATNPVDVLAHVAWRSSGLPAERVIGSGTILDTARFRWLLSDHLRVDPRSVHGFVIGEHGDSEVPVWSSANIAGMRIPDFCAANGIPFDASIVHGIDARTREAAYEIIERKGATYYAVGAGLLRIVEAILRDQRTVLSVSALTRGVHGIEDVYLSLPAIVGRRGVERVLQLDLSVVEAAALRRSAEVLRAALDGLPAPA